MCVATKSAVSVSLGLVANHELELSHAPFQVEQVLVQIGLLGLEDGDGSLSFLVLSFLSCVVALHVVLGPGVSKEFVLAD